MKLKYHLITAVSCSVLLGCDPRPESQSDLLVATPKRSRDFVMDSPTAVSNALRFQGPPEGWTIACNQDGLFCPMRDGFAFDVYDNEKCVRGTTTVRKDKFQAVVAAWRTKEVLEGIDVNYSSPKQVQTNVWTVCK